MDTPRQTVAPGASATVHYTVSVTHDAGTDSAWQVNGTITVNNPNAFDVSGVSLGEATDNGGICSVTNGANLTVPAGQSVTASYTCGYAAAPSPGSGTATATASWADYGAPDTSATGTAAFDFGSTTPTLKDGSVSVSDSLQGSLGTVLSGDPSPTTFTYALTFAGTPGTCTAYQNTAAYTTDDTQTSGTAGQTVTVCKQAQITATGTDVTATEGTPFGAVAATFTSDAAPSLVLSKFIANIDWGDGVQSPGTISANPDGSFSVSGNHSYAEEGSYATKVTIMDGQGGSSSTGGQATVADAALTATGGVTVRATEGQAFPSQTVATFIDANPKGPTSDYSATIDWGDGTTSAGTVSGAGGGSVSGSHVYAEEGTYTITTTIDDVGGSQASTTSTVIVADAPLRATGGLTVQATEGQASTSQTVATFSDADPNGTVSDYSATIAWGDGTTSAGTISANGDGTFSVNGGHTYAEEGSYPTKVTIHDAGGSQATASSTATVADPAVAATGGVTFQATEGQPSANQTVATFSDPGGAEAPGDYSATVDWGDGSAAATGTINANGDGTFSVAAGGHTYAEEGAYTVTVTISHHAAPAVTVTSTAQVSDAALTAAGKTLLSGTGTAFSGTVATFTDADPNGTVGDYSATIDWGDGSAASVGTVSANVDGSFSVSGSHTYPALGPYTVTVRIADVGGSTTTATTSLLNFAYLAQGSFTLGDKTVAAATPSTDVLWWGAQWDQWAGGDTLSGGPAPAAFKGFAQSLSSTPPACGGSWTTGPGNSPAPPSSVPTYMAVLVPSTVTQSGSTISGNVVHVVVVKTDSGYAPAPGHLGTGTIVAQVC